MLRLVVTLPDRPLGQERAPGLKPCSALAQSLARTREDML